MQFTWLDVSSPFFHSILSAENRSLDGTVIVREHFSCFFIYILSSEDAASKSFSSQLDLPSPLPYITLFPIRITSPNSKALSSFCRIWALGFLFPVLLISGHTTATGKEQAPAKAEPKVVAHAVEVGEPGSHVCVSVDGARLSPSLKSPRPIDRFHIRDVQARTDNRRHFSASLVNTHTSATSPATVGAIATIIGKRPTTATGMRQTQKKAAVWRAERALVGLLIAASIMKMGMSAVLRTMYEE
ncbi:uncharacterized protein J3D65DRAFT_362323 [Phyllosticta citribraziliensis]|uniref:Uncharacterized protein n=1 Tax=Phyllosticta citribraziliensis TaxID=989973 RepID=A0ABR1LPC2_9PEZI